MRGGGPTDRTLAVLLGGLVALDAALTVLAFGFPALWFRVFHDAPYVDPQGLLRRTGAQWLGFALVQGVALARFRAAPWWLAAVAGVRLCDCLTDAVYLLACAQITWYGAAMLAVAGPANLVIGLYLLRAARRAT